MQITIMPLHKMATPMWAQDGRQGRAVVGYQASRGGQLGGTRPAGEGS